MILQSAGIGEDFRPRVEIASDKLELMSALVSGALSPVEGWSAGPESVLKYEELGINLH